MREKKSAADKECFEVTCERCGAVIPEALSRRRKVCDGCKKIARREYESYRRAIASSRESQAHPKGNSRYTINEVAQLALDAGMSYGEYVAKHGDELRY